MGLQRQPDDEGDEYVDSSQEDARLIQSESQPPSPASRRPGSLRKLGPMFLLSLSNLVSLSALVLLLVTRDDISGSRRPCAVVPDRHAHWVVPEIPVTKILEASDEFTRPPDEDELKAWGHLMPLGRGLIMVNSTGLPEMPGLNMSSPRGTSGWTSIAHQLHCLVS
ncbi:hypothetical protein CTA2_12122, partial [Colletotrichum tanaceti]